MVIGMRSKTLMALILTGMLTMVSLGMETQVSGAVAQAGAVTGAEAQANAPGRIAAMAQAVSYIQGVLDAEARLSTQAREALTGVHARLKAQAEAEAHVQTEAEAKATASASAKIMAEAAATLESMTEAEIITGGASDLAARAAADLNAAVYAYLGLDADALLDLDLKIGLPGLGESKAGVRTGAVGVVAVHVEDVKAAIKARGGLDASTGIKAGVAQLILIAQTQGKVETEVEAMATVESALKVRQAAGLATPAEMDMRAQVLMEQGNRKEARATLLARLQAEPRADFAYAALLGLEADLGLRQDLDTYVNGAKIDWDVRPFIQAGRTLVPIRLLVEALGAQVQWNAETLTVTLIKGSTEVLLKIDSQVALVNGREVTLDVAATIQGGGRTVVPIRFVSEALGLQVQWLSEHRAIVVVE